jgi:hypothetical protein
MSHSGIGSLDCRLTMLDRASQQSHPVSQKPRDVAYTTRFFGASLSPDGAWLAVVDPSATTLTVHALLGDGTPISHQIAGSVAALDPGASFAFSPDGRRLVFLEASDTVELWPVGRPEPPVTITVPGLHGLTALSVAPA